MIFNDDSMLDFRGNGFGDSITDSIFGYDIGEIVITGRVPGALYVDDFSAGEYGLQHIQPLEYAQDQLAEIIILDVTEQADASGSLEEALPPVVEEPSNGLNPANDDDAPVGLALAGHGKSVEPLVLIPGSDSDGGGFGDLNALDLDLAIPPIPAFSNHDAPSDILTAPSVYDADQPLIIGGRAYESLSFLIIDTPFAVGDSLLPSVLRPSLNELLGLVTDDEDAFVLPARGWVLN